MSHWDNDNSVVDVHTNLIVHILYPYMTFHTRPVHTTPSRTDLDLYRSSILILQIDTPSLTALSGHATIPVRNDGHSSLDAPSLFDLGLYDFLHVRLFQEMQLRRGVAVCRSHGAKLDQPRVQLAS